MTNLRAASAIACVLACLTAACVNTPPLSSAARAELAPTGTLRAGINYGNVVLATRNPQAGKLDRSPANPPPNL